MSVIISFETNNINVCIDELTAEIAIKAYEKVVKAIVDLEPTVPTEPQLGN